MVQFYHPKSTSADAWRALVLFGRNTAAYKFAFGRSLLSIAETGRDRIVLEDLAPLYCDELIRHLRKQPKQTTNPSSSFLDACVQHEAGQLSREDLLSITMKEGFRYVVGAFQNLRGGALEHTFYSQGGPGSGHLELHDGLLDLASSSVRLDLMNETESRWQLVETAWSLGLSERVLEVGSGDHLALVVGGDRTNVTSSRGALNGYQKGHCFYCFAEISTVPGDARLGEVDHFLPFSLRSALPDLNINGVWNLVLACSNCNGPHGKWDRLPQVKYLKRLHTRNEFLIQSKHPLRESLIAQTGSTSQMRATSLQRRYSVVAKSMAVNPTFAWEVKHVNPPQF